MEQITIENLVGENAMDLSHELALSVLQGLSTRPKGLPSKLFYDDKGSQLFTQIMELEQYYPTRCEKEILGSHGQSMARYLGDADYNIVELGCGDGAKTILLFNELLRSNTKFSYVPLDISRAAVEFLLSNLRKEFGEIEFEVKGLIAEYFQGLTWLNRNAAKKNLVLFLGSNIGNLNKPMALRFLRHLWYSLNSGDFVLIGFDLKKDLDILYDAYNDRKGITKEFNFNVLDRINEVLGGNFERKNFQHQGLFNVQTGAMESYLISQNRHVVTIADLGKDFMFEPWEAIHMEYSYKYLESDIEGLALGTGFKIVENFKDSKSYFVDSLWQVVK